MSTTSGFYLTKSGKKIDEIQVQDIESQKMMIDGLSKKVAHFEQKYEQMKVTYKLSEEKCVLISEKLACRQDAFKKIYEAYT